MNRVFSRRSPRGVVLWEGPSQLDGEPTVAIMTFHTSNVHTGPEIQSWILRSDIGPMDAIKTGADFSICGDCPLRGVAKGTTWSDRGCMIMPLHGPHPVYRQYVAGAYPKASVSLFRRYLSQQMLRLGTYGDPVAVPLAQWEWALGFTRAHTAYTSQWRLPIAQPYRLVCMASVKCEADARDAVAMGWRYFRIRRPSDPVLPSEIICPKSAEAGFRTNCYFCGACDGWKRAGQSNIVIIAHGSKVSRAATTRALDRLATT